MPWSEMYFTSAPFHGILLLSSLSLSFLVTNRILCLKVFLSMLYCSGILILSVFLFLSSSVVLMHQLTE